METYLSGLESNYLFQYKMIKAIIVDDELSARQSLSKCIQEYCEDVHVVGMGKNVEEAIDLIYRHSPDIVFLDIEMPMGNGFTLFEKFKKPDFETIFTTAFEEYALKAFRVAALDYLTKPIDFRELQEAITKFKHKQKVELKSQRIELLIDNMTNRPSKFSKLVVPDNQGFSLINVSDIVYCEADGSYTDVHLLSGKKITASKVLNEILELLPNETFFRIHRSHFINLNLLDRFTKTDGNQVVMCNGVLLDVSDRLKKPFLDKINSK